ncbi:hypothetical protein K0B04_03215 [Patescibacteria group bacterium]|nr:hypothetical protein [Patescibacteria group bacterium]
MNPEQIEKFKNIWLKCVVGKELDSNNNSLKTFLYESLIFRNDEILKILELRIPYTEGIDFLEDLVVNFSTVESNHLGFFPVGIMKTKKLTCAGNAMLANTILANKEFEVSYARPSGHSVNIVNIDTEFYWVDTTNNIFDNIRVKVEKKKTFSIAHIDSGNEKINYKIVPFFESQDVIINIFGNMEALKSRDDDDEQVQQYLKENKSIYEVNFNDVKEMLYTEYFDYVRYDTDFQKEQERIKNWVEES